MLVYSRNILISLRNWHKILKLSTQPHGSVERPISEEVWQRLAFYKLLAPTRGQRGGGSHLKDHRPILNRRKKYCTQNLPNRWNLLNIQVMQNRRNQERDGNTREKNLTLARIFLSNVCYSPTSFKGAMSINFRQLFHDTSGAHNWNKMK